VAVGAPAAAVVAVGAAAAAVVAVGAAAAAVVAVACPVDGAVVGCAAGVQAAATAPIPLKATSFNIFRRVILLMINSPFGLYWTIGFISRRKTVRFDHLLDT
jgi:hypothetical protein